MRLTYNIDFMHSDKSVESLVERLNTTEGITATMDSNAPFKRVLTIDTDEEINDDDILTLGSFIGSHLASRL